jgi:hypothetical protein
VGTSNLRMSLPTMWGGQVGTLDLGISLPTMWGGQVGTLDLGMSVSCAARRSPRTMAVGCVTD